MRHLTNQIKDHSNKKRHKEEFMANMESFFAQKGYDDLSWGTG
mgnify:CR=1 FL=1